MPNIPPLPAIRAFEAVARSGGFARAAVELNVSTSAVSHRIRSLETSLGVRLLDRSTGIGGVRLTSAGTRLLTAASAALSLLEDACSEIKGQGRQLTVSANAPFSAMWLARRLAEFSGRNPDTPVNAIVQDGDPDFARYDIDLAVVHVREAEMQPDDLILLQDEVFPVCSPELLSVASTAARRCRLLQEAHENFPEIEWRTWSAEFDLADDFETRIVRYTSFSQVIGAAIGGAGIALGRVPLIEPDLASGRLVRVFPSKSRLASWRFVLRPGPARQHRMLDALIAFLCAEAMGHR